MAETFLLDESTARKKPFSTVNVTLNAAIQPRSCSELLAELQTPEADLRQARSLEFVMPDGRDVYNITAPFEFGGRTLLMGRVENRDTEFSEIIVFERHPSSHWVPFFTHPAFEGLQDPCISHAGEKLVIGGVRYPVPIAPGVTGYRMDFYRGSSLDSLRHFLTGPNNMKDIRFVELPTGKVAVFSRPQGAIGGLGEIGFTIADSWDDISADLIASAPLFDRQILQHEWAGANEVHLLDNGRLGVLGHIACFDEQRNRHYYPMAFSVDPQTHQASAIRIIAQRSFFPDGPAKRPDLADVVFSGGLVRNRDATASLYAGTSDAAAAVVTIPDPFLEYEG